MMKRIILTCLAAGLLGLAGLGEEAGTHVQFDFYNAALAPQGARGLAVFPELIDAANPLGLTTHDRIYRSTSAGGSVVISNLVWGDYRVEFYGPTITTTNWFSVPATNTGALLNVTNLIRQAHAWQGRHAATYGPWNLLPGSNVVFSTGPGVTYVNATGDGGWTEATTATGWKLVEPEYAGGTNTFAPVYQLTQGNGIVVNPVTTAVGSGLYTVKTQWMELDREIVVWTNAAGDLITRSPYDEVDDMYVFTSKTGTTNFDATTGWPGWGIGWQGLTNSGVLAAKWSWTTNYVLQGWGLNGQVPEDGAVLAWGTGLDYNTNGGVWTVYATNIPAGSLGTSNAPAAGKVLTVDAGTNLYWGEGGGGSVNAENIVWPYEPLTPLDWNFTSISNVSSLDLNFLECSSIFVRGGGSLSFSGLMFATNGITSYGDISVESPAQFIGNGGGLTNLNASALSDGTVPLARLSGNYGVHLNSAYYVAWQTNGFIPYVPGPKNELGERTPQNLGLTLNKGFYMASQEGLGGVFKVLWTADGTNWQSGWTNVPVTIGVSMDIAEAGYQGQMGITNLTLWSWTNPELFGRSNYMHSQFLFVDRPKYPDQVAPKRTVETIANRAVREQPNWATIPAKATVNLNSQTVRHTGEWKQRVSATEQANELRWCWLGTNVWSLSAPPTVAIAVPPPNLTNDVSNGTNFILHLPDTYTPESLRVLYSHRLEPDDWRCLPSVNVATNGEVQVSFSVPDVDYGFFKVVEDSGAPVVASLKGVLEMTPRTITNSNASTWGKGAGLICVDANYIYISTGTNTWKRAALGW